MAMSVKKCPKCGSVWSSALPKCAFCGVEGEEQIIPILTGKVHGQRAVEAAAEPAPEPASEEGAVAVAEATPVPPTRTDPPPPVLTKLPVNIVNMPPAPEPVLTKMPDIFVNKPAPKALVPAPQVPSATVPLVFGWLGIASCGLFALAVLADGHRVAGILAPLAVSLLMPFAPFAWFAGRRHEDRCRELGFEPSRAALAGRTLGRVSTFLLIFETAALACAVAVLRISGKLPPSFGG
jgi:hypothetical protein